MSENGIRDMSAQEVISKKNPDLECQEKIIYLIEDEIYELPVQEKIWKKDPGLERKDKICYISEVLVEIACERAWNSEKDGFICGNDLDYVQRRVERKITHSFTEKELDIICTYLNQQDNPGVDICGMYTITQEKFDSLKQSIQKMVPRINVRCRNIRDFLK